MVSAGLEKVVEIVEKRYHPSNWNIYTFQCSDGDNWPDDTDRTMVALEKIKNFSQLTGYCEIEPNGERSSWQSEWKLSIVYQRMIDEKFKISKIKQKSDIWKSFKSMFSKRTIVGGF